MRLFLLTGLAMLAFAANSLLNRAALAEQAIDPHNFTLMRLGSGAITLVLIAMLVNRKSMQDIASAGTWRSAFALFIYAIGFSIAYLWLGAGMGALILFAMVQFTMLGVAIIKGDRPSPLELIGLLLALVGFVALVSPGFDQAPNLQAVGLMASAGIAWGAYSLWGRGSTTPTLDTAGNFWRAFLMGSIVIVPILLMQLSPSLITVKGMLLAIASGALASGVGYAIWYTALPGLTRTRAGIVQLSVPALAAIAGVVFLGEPLTVKFAALTVMILAGVGLATLAKPKASAQNSGK
ncbi:EamA-like transporter family protein [Maritalea mobilis]|uniref:EamA-like transporter family protein n=1 Tax=Maritalea mobilis TaxID=483324 RepID=A0A4R6VWE4_9HYPH|nr:DMT family transporter [Maritalea mobilis]TDQ66930.1 EamA-like transporter family protein [Maritalea mobilis]